MSIIKMASMLLNVLPRIYDSAHAEAVAIRDSKKTGFGVVGDGLKAFGKTFVGIDDSRDPAAANNNHSTRGRQMK
jgi:hypothetical protein